MADRYSHPGKRPNPGKHGTLARAAKGCKCWRCLNMVGKVAKALAEKGTAA